MRHEHIAKLFAIDAEQIGHFAGERKAAALVQPARRQVAGHDLEVDPVDAGLLPRPAERGVQQLRT